MKCQMGTKKITVNHRFLKVIFHIALNWNNYTWVESYFWATKLNWRRGNNRLLAHCLFQTSLHNQKSTILSLVPFMLIGNKKIEDVPRNMSLKRPKYSAILLCFFTWIKIKTIQIYLRILNQSFEPSSLSLLLRINFFYRIAS